MDSLIYFSVQGCSKLKKIPEFSGQMKNLSMLILSGTPIEKLPSSIGRLVGLTFLDVGNCENLLGLPREICNLKSLEVLYVDGCSYSDKRQESSQEMDHSMISMPNYSESCSVGFQRYYPLKCRSEPNKSWFWWGLRRKAFVLDSLHDLRSLKELDLNDCGLCDIPGDIGSLSSLEKLNLSRNNFVNLPASIGCLSKLRSFWVNGCRRLQQLPHLRFNFRDIAIYTDDCTSLKMLPKLSIKNGSRFVMLGCVNCFGLVENALDWNSIILGMLWNTWRFVQAPARIRAHPDFQIVTPGSKIPEWFNNQSVGDSLIVELPPCTTPIWIALCAVIEDDHPNPPHDLSTYFDIHCSLGLNVSIDKGHLVSPHLWVSCAYHYVKDNECSQMKILFSSGIKKCGFRLVHKQDVEELNQIMMMNDSINISTKATSPHNSADQVQVQVEALTKNLSAAKAMLFPKGF